MTCKILLLVVVIVLVTAIATGGCMMLFTNIFGCKDKGGDGAMMNSTESMPDYEEEVMSSESFAILPTDGDEMINVDGLFPDSMGDDLKLELILKALELLKTLDKDDVHRWLPRHDEMTEELKLKLILKAILLLKEKKLTSTFSGHLVADLKLTLILKAIHILQDEFETTVTGPTIQIDERAYLLAPELELKRLTHHTNDERAVPKLKLKWLALYYLVVTHHTN